MSNLTSERIKALGLVLPPAPPPAGLYKPVLEADGYLYISGQGPMKNDGSYITGRIGDDMDLSQGKLAAEQVGLTMLATIFKHFGDIDRIERLVKTLGMVNSTLEFDQHPLVINGFSELMADVFGMDCGVGARSAVGMVLPGHVAVEIEAIFKLRR
ncbi:MAG: RidA family protein [Flavobacteriaceae bacterium]